MDLNYRENAFPQPTTKRRVDADGPDFYPTPAWATHALCLHETFEGGILEPACGDGAMVKVLESYGHRIDCYDLHDRGFGQQADFLKETRPAHNIVTNPPYNSAESFVEKGLQLAQHKLALLLRLPFLEGTRRNQTLFSINPPTRVWVFSERVTFYPANVEKKGGGTTAYAWFVWDKQSKATTELKWFPTGLKARYSRL